MRFELPFNEIIYREQSKKYFAFIWKDFQLKNKKKLYIIIPYALLGALIIYAKSNLGYLFLTISIFNLFQYFKLYQHHKTNKEKYLSKVEEKIEEQRLSKEMTIIEFSEDKFYYSDVNLEIKTNWNSFSSYTILENDLFLEAKKNIFITFFINKEEIGEIEFESIIVFLESKIIKE